MSLLASVCVFARVSVCRRVNPKLVGAKTYQLYKLGLPNWDRRCNTPRLRTLLFGVEIDFDFESETQLKSQIVIMPVFHKGKYTSKLLLIRPVDLCDYAFIWPSAIIIRPMDIIKHSYCGVCYYYHIILVNHLLTAVMPLTKCPWQMIHYCINVLKNTQVIKIWSLNQHIFFQPINNT